MKKAEQALFGWETLAALGAYAALLVAYVTFVLQLLAEPLHWLRENHGHLYVAAALALILAQAMALEFVAGWLLLRFAEWRRGAARRKV